MAQYDFFIAGRWRNKENIKLVLDTVRAHGNTAHCFIESLHGRNEASVTSGSTELLPQDDPLVRRIFEDDMQGERDSDNFLLVLPAGIAGHMEAGVAYGMGKKCYAVGKLEKTETLYCVFDTVFPDVAALKEWLKRRSDGQ